MPKCSITKVLLLKRHRTLSTFALCTLTNWCWRKSLIFDLRFIWNSCYIKVGFAKKKEFKVSEDLKFEALWRLDLLAEPRLKFKFLKYYEQQIFSIFFFQILSSIFQISSTANEWETVPAKELLASWKLVTDSVCVCRWISAMNQTFIHIPLLCVPNNTQWWGAGMNKNCEKMTIDPQQTFVLSLPN